MVETIEVGVCGPGRHEIKSPTTGKDVELFAFPEIVENPLDFDGHYQTAVKFFRSNTAQPNHPEALRWRIFVTGLTPCLTAMLLALRDVCPNQTIQLMHYNRDTGGYKEQRWQN
jgi:hypothetical protein